MAVNSAISSSVKSGGSERSELDCWLPEGRPYVAVAIASEVVACKQGKWTPRGDRLLLRLKDGTERCTRKAVGRLKNNGVKGLFICPFLDFYPGRNEISLSGWGKSDMATSYMNHK